MRLQNKSFESTLTDLPPNPILYKDVERYCNDQTLASNCIKGDNKIPPSLSFSLPSAYIITCLELLLITSFTAMVSLWSLTVDTAKGRRQMVAQ